jgi:hypothetical protein
MLHERYCVLNVKKCIHCGEIINIEDEQEHVNEKHVDVTCEFCQGKFPKQEIKTHTANCVERQVECKFCALGISFKDRKEHETICGAKTEYCPSCKKYIPIKNYEYHIESGCYPDDIYLSNHLNVDRIKKKNGVNVKPGQGKQNIAKDQSHPKDVHKELKAKIDSLMKEQKELERNKPLPKHIIPNQTHDKHILPSSHSTKVVEPPIHQHTAPKSVTVSVSKTTSTVKVEIPASRIQQLNNQSAQVTTQHIKPSITVKPNSNSNSTSISNSTNLNAHHHVETNIKSSDTVEVLDKRPAAKTLPYQKPAILPHHVINNAKPQLGLGNHPSTKILSSKNKENENPPRKITKKVNEDKDIIKVDTVVKKDNKKDRK